MAAISVATAASAQEGWYGAVDFLQKPPSEEELLSTVRRALALFSQSEEQRNAQQEAVARLQRLSPRERQILQGLLSGLSNKQIAHRLQIADATAKNHVKNILAKLNAHDRTEATRVAIQRGFVTLP